MQYNSHSLRLSFHKSTIQPIGIIHKWHHSSRGRGNSLCDTQYKVVSKTLILMWPREVSFGSNLRDIIYLNSHVWKYQMFVLSSPAFFSLGQRVTFPIKVIPKIPNLSTFSKFDLLSILFGQFSPSFKKLGNTTPMKSSNKGRFA